jgi:protein involved in polysaccharide export with SLBB domain
MQRRSGKMLNKYTLFSAIVFFCTLPAFSQPVPEIPSVQNPGGILQNVDPTKLTPTGLQAYFKDQNNKGKEKETGPDRNKQNQEILKRLENKSLDKDSLQKDNIKASAYSPEQTYGANIFSNAATTDLSELSTPPLDYPIGVGDHLIVALWGGGEFQEDYIVARDGSIFPAGLGKIYVQGLTFENARSVVYARFISRVPAGTNIAISLGQPRSINVNVVGEVHNPGPVTVSAFANAFSVIAIAGGVTEFGNLREIQIKRAGRVIDVIDVYRYLTTGEYGKQSYLQNNDFVIVKFYEKKVLATGQFKRPMYYQLKKDEGVKALLKYSGGLTGEAFASGMKVLRTENEKQVQKDVNANAIIKLNDQDASLNDGDIVKVDLIKPGIINKVELRGEVNYPAVYELRPGDRLFDVINRAGGVTRNTYLPRAYIFRGAGDSTNIKSNKLEINLTTIDKNKISDENNVLLQANDVIQLFTQAEFGEQQYVEIFGEVRREGKQKRYSGMSLQDLLYLSGGIKPSAEYGRLEISSIIDMDSAQLNLKPTRTIVKSYKILPSLELDSAAAKIILKPYDQIFVRKNPTFELQQNVRIEGLVKYPGDYPRLNKSERISSYIERAGGIKENANLSGAVLYRNKTDLLRESLVRKPKFDSSGREIQDSVVADLARPVSIDLFKAMTYKNSKHDIVLQERDVVYIPEINPFVSVGGTVQSPLKIAFDKEHTNLAYYIDKAGGFGVRPWRKRIYVTYANGKSRRTKNFFFMHFYPKVEEGCSIIVPVRPEGKEVSDIAIQTVTATVPIIISAIIIKYLNK